MKIKIKFSTFFENLSGVKKAELYLHPDATAKDALEKIVDNFPKLKEWLPHYVWIFINGNYVESRTQLKNDDEIVLFPPIEGG